MEKAQPKDLPDLGNNLGPVVDEPAQQGAPTDLEKHMLYLTQQLAALTALVATTVQNQPASVKFVGANESQPIPEPEKTPANERRVWIVLEDNEEIPPGGQFMSVDGRPYLLKSGEPAHVPVSLVDVLDHAVKSMPVTDENRNVIAYRDRLRFPYRVVRNRDGERAQAADTEEVAGVTVSME